MTTIQLLKAEAIDRLDSIINDIPKYKTQLNELIINFTIDATIQLISTIDRDIDFKNSMYYKLYSNYFDEIEELINQNESEIEKEL